MKYLHQYRAARRNTAAKPWPGITPTGRIYRPPIIAKRSVRGEKHYQSCKGRAA